MRSSLDTSTRRTTTACRGRLQGNLRYSIVASAAAELIDADRGEA
jgi:hypothetical protein